MFNVGDIITAQSQYSSGRGTVLYHNREYTIVEIVTHRNGTFYIVDNVRHELLNTSGYINNELIDLTLYSGRDGYWAIKERMAEFVRQGITGVCVDCKSTCKVDKNIDCPFREEE